MIFKIVWLQNLDRTFFTFLMPNSCGFTNYKNKGRYIIGLVKFLLEALIVGTYTCSRGQNNRYQLPQIGFLIKILKCLHILRTDICLFGKDRHLFIWEGQTLVYLGRTDTCLFGKDRHLFIWEGQTLVYLWWTDTCLFGKDRNLFIC